MCPPVTRRRHERTSGGIRVDASSLRTPLAISGRLELQRPPYPRAILYGTLPFSLGGGFGRTQMLRLRKAHIGEVRDAVRPRRLKEISVRHSLDVLGRTALAADLGA